MRLAFGVRAAWVVLGLVLSASACGNINYPEKLACGPNGECPSGQKCNKATNQCLKPEHMNTTDAAAGSSGSTGAGGTSGVGGDIGTAGSTAGVSGTTGAGADGGFSGTGVAGAAGSTIDAAVDAPKDGGTAGTPGDGGGGTDGPPPCVCNDDGNPCTKDMCVNNVCTHPNQADDMACTMAGATGSCHMGNCCTTCWDGTKCQPGSTDTLCGKGGAACATCNDNKDCTDDNCTNFACTHTNRSGACNAGKGVCVADTCACGGTGQPCCATAPACKDNSACSTSGSCGNCGAVGQPCCGTTCSGNAVCLNAACAACGGIGQPCCTGSVCGSGNVCNAGTCSKCGGTGQLCCPGNACDDDANACNGAEVCTGGACGHGAAPNCADANPCTDDTCDATLGCQHNANTATCNDGNACTTADHCVNKACVGGPAPTCPGPGAGPNQKCGMAACDPTTGCFIAPVGNGTACDDATVCNGRETCQGGTCTNGAAPVCGTGGNVCVTASCDAVTGCKTTPVGNNTPCSDGNVCNGQETCQNGTCANGTAPVCSTGLHCVNPTGCVCDGVSCPSPANTCVTSTRCYVNYYTLSDEGTKNISLYRFDLAGNKNKVLSLGLGFAGLTGRAGDGSLWTIQTDSTNNFSTLYRIDVVGLTAKPQFGLGLGFTEGITYDKDTGLFYAIQYDATTAVSTLYYIDLVGTVKPVGVMSSGSTGLTYEPSTKRFFTFVPDATFFYSIAWFSLPSTSPKPLFGVGLRMWGGITATSDPNQFYGITLDAAQNSSVLSINLSGAVNNVMGLGVGFQQAGVSPL